MLLRDCRAISVLIPTASYAFLMHASLPIPHAAVPHTQTHTPEPDTFLTCSHPRCPACASSLYPHSCKEDTGERKRTQAYTHKFTSTGRLAFLFMYKSQCKRRNLQQHQVISGCTSMHKVND